MNLETAKAVRVTPALIAKSQQQISLGLENIYKNAPLEIKPQLEYQYGSQQLAQVESLTKRMITEQRSDQGDMLSASNKSDSERANYLARSGNIDAAMSIVETNKRKNESGWNAHIITKEGADAAIKTVRKSALNGKVIYDYEKAKSERKLRNS